MTTNERDKTSERPATDGGDCPSGAEPLRLDEQIRIAKRLLPRFRSLDTAELRALAVHLRVLSNVAEGRAQRPRGISRRDDA